MAEYLFHHLDQLEKNLNHKKLFLFFDFDGTLSPIVKKPESAIIYPGIKPILDEFLKRSDIHIAVISGRSLHEIQERVGLSQVIYAGNHGYELSGADLNFIHPEVEQTVKLLSSIAQILEEKLKSIEGIRVENKIYSLSIHYRLANEDQVPHAEKIVLMVINNYLEGKDIKLRHGKKVWEIRPNIDWNKGSIVSWLLEQIKGYYPIYIGDDQTDEDAFCSLNNKGLTIKVSDGAFLTEAHYYVEGPEEVLKFLQWLSVFMSQSKS